MLKKILNWIPANLAPLLGIIQVGVKFIKEVLTLVVSLLYPIIPSSKFQSIIDSIRNWVNILDGWIGRIKSFLLTRVAP